MEPVTQTPVEVITEVLTPDLVMAPGQQLPITLDSMSAAHVEDGSTGATTDLIAPTGGAEARRSTRSQDRLRRLGAELL